MTDLGSETSPLSMTGEQWVLETRTNDPAAPAPDERWIRTDLNEGDRVATLMCGDGTEIPLFPVGLAEETVREARRFNVGGETVFAPLAPLDDASFPERRFQHDGQLHAFHDHVAPGSAIPDSVVHQHLVNDFTTSNWPDSIGNSDMDSISGLTLDDSAFGGDGAVVGGGADHGRSDPMAGFGSNMDTDFAIAVGVSTTDVGTLFGLLNDTDDTVIELTTTDRFGGTSGRLTFAVRDGGGDDISAETSYDITDGNDRVFIINKTGNSAGGLDIYDSPTNEVSQPLRDNNFSNPADFEFDMAYYASNNRGTIIDELSADMSHIRWFDDSLTEAEREDVFESYDWWS